MVLAAITLFILFNNVLLLLFYISIIIISISFSFQALEYNIPRIFCYARAIVYEILDMPIRACNDLFLGETENRVWFNIQRGELSLQHNMSIHRDDWPACSIIAVHHFNAGHALTHNAHVHYIFIRSIIWALCWRTSPRPCPHWPFSNLPFVLSLFRMLNW